MSFDIGETVNGIVDYLCNSTVMHYIISNPFITALLLVAIVVSIFLGFFYKDIKHQSKLSFIKLYIYSFLSAAIILLFHYRCQEKDIEKTHESESGRKLYASIGGTDSKSLLSEEKNYTGGNFIKVNTESCGCNNTGSQLGGNENKVTSSSTKPVEQKAIATTVPTPTPSIVKEAAVNVSDQRPATIVHPPITSGGVNVIKIPIVPSSKMLVPNR